MYISQRSDLSEENWAGVHFTIVFTIANQIPRKFSFTGYAIPVNDIIIKFVQPTASQLLCRVINFVAIDLLDFEWEQYTFFISLVQWEISSKL